MTNFALTTVIAVAWAALAFVYCRAALKASQPGANRQRGEVQS